jgi:hypothetical protein
MSDWTGSTGLTVITLILVLSFAIDRVVAGLMFLLSFSNAWSRKYPEPTLLESSLDRFNAERRRKLVYFVFASILAFGVLIFADQVRVLSALGFRSTRPADKALASPTPSRAAGSTTSTPAPTPMPTTDLLDAPRETSRTFAILDFLISGLILIGGADRIEHLLRSPGGGGGRGRDESKPLEIKGKITVEDESGK